MATAAAATDVLLYAEAELAVEQLPFNSGADMRFSPEMLDLYLHPESSFKLRMLPLVGVQTRGELEPSELSRLYESSEEQNKGEPVSRFALLPRNGVLAGRFLPSAKSTFSAS